MGGTGATGWGGPLYCSYRLAAAPGSPFEGGGMSEARLIRRTRFRAVHHYSRSDWSQVENRRVFGAQVEPHEHEWLVEVHVVGPLDEETGFATDLGALDGALRAALAGWDGGDLNALIPEVATGQMQPSTEGLARWLHGRLGGAVSYPARVVEVVQKLRGSASARAGAS